MSIWVTDGGDVSVVGDVGLILSSTGDGNWTSRQSWPNVWLSGVWADENGKHYGVGDEGTILVFR